MEKNINKRDELVQSVMLIEQSIIECMKINGITDLLDIGGGSWTIMLRRMLLAKEALVEKIEREYPGPLSLDELDNVRGCLLWFIDEKECHKSMVRITEIKETAIIIKDERGGRVSSATAFGVSRSGNGYQRFYLYEPEASWESA